MRRDRFMWKGLAWLALGVLACHQDLPAQASPGKGPRKGATSMKEVIPDGCAKLITPAEASHLQTLVEELPEGSVVCLQAGHYVLPATLLIRRSVGLRRMD